MLRTRAIVVAISMDICAAGSGIRSGGRSPPGEHQIEVFHEQVRCCRSRRYARSCVAPVASFRASARRRLCLGRSISRARCAVVAGGPHVSYWVEEALEHVDAVVVGEAETVWLKVLDDARRGVMDKVYRGKAAPLVGLPTPRYDLLEKRFVVPRVLQATRGCPFSCSFCSVPDFESWLPRAASR